MNNIKTIAFYLPQFHEIEENNQWWGKGFTEWTNVKKAEPLYEGHYQPRIPMNLNYYNLLDVETIRWQAGLAKKYGIDGFCIYHYWFNGKMLLEKPIEILRNNEDIDIEYCMCWANESWTNAWVSAKNTVLIEQTYGDESEWKEHFEYFLRFFKDSRYIKNENKPLLIIYRPELIKNLNQMLIYWDELAKEHGFSGMEFGYQQSGLDELNGDNSLFKYDIEYQPKYALKDIDEKSGGRKLLRKLVDQMNRTIFKKHVLQRNRLSVKKYDYDAVWKKICERRPKNEKSVAGAFVDWDNTPRRGKNGFVIDGATPEKFGAFMAKQYENIQKNYLNKMVFIFAWNEWAEGGYLEPDEKFRLSYLEELSKAKQRLK